MRSRSSGSPPTSSPCASGRCSSQVEPGEIRAALPTTPPEHGEPFSAVLDDLDAVLLPGLTHWQSPRFFAYFATTGAEPGVLAELLIAGLNQVGILWRTSPALQELEEVTVDWLRQLVGLPDVFRGHIEDTASTGVLGAVVVARSLQPDRRVLVCSEHAHSVAEKAARLLGLELRKVPTDDASGSAPICSSRTTPARSSRRSGRPGWRPSIPCRRSRTAVPQPARGFTSTRRTRARRRSSPSSASSSQAGSAPTRSA